MFALCEISNADDSETASALKNALW